MQAKIRSRLVEPLPKELPSMERGMALMLIYYKIQELIDKMNALAYTLEEHTHAE